MFLKFNKSLSRNRVTTNYTVRVELTAGILNVTGECAVCKESPLDLIQDEVLIKEITRDDMNPVGKDERTQILKSIRGSLKIKQRTICHKISCADKAAKILETALENVEYEMTS